MRQRINRSLSVLLLAAVVTAALLVLAPQRGAADAFNVTNTNDSGPGSLRKAIEEANAGPGSDTIRFNIPGSHTIKPRSPLPKVTGPVLIDGWSEPDFHGSPIVEIDGSLAGDCDCFYITASDCTVRGLVINRFKKSAISLENSARNKIQGNYLGTDVRGTKGLANGAYGLRMKESNENVVGGKTPSLRNLISGNAFDGIYLEKAESNLISGNFVGTDVSGKAAVPNGNHGILVDRGSISNSIGGTATGARNVISGNLGNGIYIRYASLSNSVQGNYIGTDVTGTADLGNGWSGVAISMASSLNVIGGRESGARNVIAGNDHHGISIHYYSSMNYVLGNYIGIGVRGVPLGNNQHGIAITTYSGSGNMIGGEKAASRNIIAYNGSNGVYVESGLRNTIWGNSIHDNRRMGIDLGGSGITPNDRKDPDRGPNLLQNFPVITGATQDTIEGILDSFPKTAFRLEFYSNSGLDTCGNGEGQTYIGSIEVMTDINGFARFRTPFGGANVSATATDPDGNTSEFGGRKNMGSTSWVLPEGSTGGGFDTWVSIQNPNDQDIEMDVTFATEESRKDPVRIKMAEESRTTIRVADYVPDDYSVSTFIDSNLPVVAERSMYWDRRFVGETNTPGNPQPYEMRSGHANLGVPREIGYQGLDGVDGRWTAYFPEGSTAGGFDTWILLVNPGEEDAHATLKLMTPQGAAAETEVSVPATSRRTVHLDELLPGAGEVATEVSSESLLVAERSMYWDPGEAGLQPFEMTGGHSSGGALRAASSWYLAEGSTGGGFETFVLLQNPRYEAASVTATFMNASGVAAVRELAMPPRSRATLRVSDYVPGEFNVATRINSDRPIAVERSMYWDRRTASEPYAMRDGHSTTGFTLTGSTWMVPEGSTGGGFDSWVLISNPTDTDARARVTLMTGEGSGKPFEIIVNANSRYSLHLNEHVTEDFNVAALVASDGNLVVERAMYWDRRESPGIQPYEMMGGHSAAGMDP